LKLCDKHIDQLTGDGDCFVCSREELHQLIGQLQLDRNLDNAHVQMLKAENADLKRQLQELQESVQSGVQL
jgi:ABC-type phosphate transport system auxiliary subunit